MTFNAKSADDKRQLYAVINAIAKLTYGDTADLVIDRAVGQTIPHGPTWQRNYRRGQYDSTIAQITHRWIEKHHFALAHKVAPDIFPNTPERQWRKILDEWADQDSLRLILMPSTFGVAQRQSQLEKAEQTIKLGQQFCLELDSNTDGHAIAQQGRGDHWAVLELGLNGDVTTPIAKGINRLPKDAQGNPDPLSEVSDEGLTDFVMITAATDRIPMEVANLIKWVQENECSITWVVVVIER